MTESQGRTYDIPASARRRQEHYRRLFERLLLREAENQMLIDRSSSISDAHFDRSWDYLVQSHALDHRKQAISTAIQLMAGSAIGWGTNVATSSDTGILLGLAIVAAGVVVFSLGMLFEHYPHR